MSPDGEAPDNMLPEQDDDGFALSEIERRYLEGDGYDKQGHLSKERPGDVFRELVHEIRQTRTAIRLAQATFVSKTDLEARLRTAGEEVDTLRKRAARRFVLVVVALFAMGAGGGIAGWAYVDQQNHYQASQRFDNYRYEQEQYQTCVERNTQTTQGRDFFNKYIVIESHSQDQKTADAVIALLKQFSVPSNPPDCARLKPSGPVPPSP